MQAFEQSRGLPALEGVPYARVPTTVDTRPDRACAVVSTNVHAVMIREAKMMILL
jgi:hypothetical protein